MKVICAGLPKTGTKTMAEALRMLGFGVHDVFHQFFYEKELWKKVMNNTATIEDFRTAFENVDAATDFPACVVWEQMAAAFPEAKVILMVRSSEDEWYGSLKHHFQYMMDCAPPLRSKISEKIASWLSGSVGQDFFQHTETFLPSCLACSQFYGTPNEILMKARYRQHNLYVKSACPDQRLLIFNVTQGWGPLCKFLDVPVPNEPFPMKNVKAEITKQLMKGEFPHDCGYHKLVIRVVFRRMAFLVFLFLSFICFLLCL